MVIVGAGEAGARAARALREHGWTGAVTLIGEEATEPYERPPLSKAVMTAAGEPPVAVILGAARAAELDITVLHGTRVAGIDRLAHRVLLADGRGTVAYARLLLATGARPRLLAVPGAESALYLRNVTDAHALRARLRAGAHLVVIGGGFIGLEIAASAVARGCRVTLVEAAARILMRGVPEPIAARVAARHRAAGVALHEGVGIAALRDAADGHVVVLADGRALACDAVIAGVGAVPDTSLAEACGLEIENGVRADATLRTSDPDIFAAGDCCSAPAPVYDGRRLRLEAWRNAQTQGECAARNMLGAGITYDAVPWFWSDQYELVLQVAGLPDAATTTVQREVGPGGLLFFHLGADGRLAAASAIGPLSVVREVRMAEALIAARTRPDPASLADPAIRLRTLLAR